MIKVKAYINLLDLKDTDYINSNYIVLCSKKGIIKKTTLEPIRVRAKTG